MLSEEFKLTNTSKRQSQPSVTVNKDLFPWAYAKFRDQVQFVNMVIMRVSMMMMMVLFPSGRMPGASSPPYQSPGASTENSFEKL